MKFYSLYRKVLKKIGWKVDKNNNSGILSFLFQQKFVHVLVVVVTIVSISINLTPNTNAGGLTEKAHKTILADLIQSEFGTFKEDEQFIIETFDKEFSISSVQQTYLDNLDSFRPQAKISYEGNDYEELNDSITSQDGSSIINPNIAKTEKSVKPRTEVINYKVKPGDTISTIAQEFGISVSTILWENELSAYSIIRPGDELAVLPVSGVNHKIKAGDTISSLAKKYDVEEDKIVEYNKFSQNAVLAIGQKVLIPGGRIISTPSYNTKSYTGFSAIKDIVIAPSAKPVSGNMMNWPTEGKTITQYYSWRHYGLDIANKTGTPIYSADAGTVEQAGWGTGYGNQILVDHGGGKKTRYAHLSKFYVSKGDKVTKGQAIGAMGSTGWSTGPHLHFEVIINNKKYNPLNYIK